MTAVHALITSLIPSTLLTQLVTSTTTTAFADIVVVVDVEVFTVAVSFVATSSTSDHPRYRRFALKKVSSLKVKFTLTDMMSIERSFEYLADGIVVVDVVIVAAHWLRLNCDKKSGHGLE